MTFPDPHNRDGSHKPPRTTALCVFGQHAWCGGYCVPGKKYYLSHESTHDTVACECRCHPVIVVEE